MTATKQKLLIDEVHEIEQNWAKKMFTNVYYLGILLTTERYSTRLKTLATFCRILSDTTKVTVHFHSKFIQNEWRVGLRLKIGHF